MIPASIHGLVLASDEAPGHAAIAKLAATHRLALASGAAGGPLSSPGARLAGVVLTIVTMLLDGRWITDTL